MLRACPRPSPRAPHCNSSVTLRDAETNNTRSIFLGAGARRRLRSAIERREAELMQRFAASGWRAALLDERSGSASLHAAFGI